QQRPARVRRRDRAPDRPRPAARSPAGTAARTTGARRRGEGGNAAAAPLGMARAAAWRRLGDAAQAGGRGDAQGAHREGPPRRGVPVPLCDRRRPAAFRRCGAGDVCGEQGGLRPLHLCLAARHSRPWQEAGVSRMNETATLPQPHGWLVLDKPRGLGSTQAVSAVKRALRRAGYGKVKVGHGGTLDPLAEGVLPIALGEATKLAGRMLDARKTYAFTIAFGEETDTLDLEGEVVATSPHRPPFAAVAAVCEHFTGEIEQVPPAYSALKVDGKRAYDRARAGEEVALEPRKVTIHSLTLPGTGRGTADEAGAGGAGPGGSSSDGSRNPGVAVHPASHGSPPRAGEGLYSTFATTSGRPDGLDPSSALLELAERVTLVAEVSKGTYVRALARDIAHALGTVGHVTYL